MDMISTSPERKAQLEQERMDFELSVEGIRRGHEDAEAGRTRLASKFVAELRRKHDFPR